MKPKEVLEAARTRAEEEEELLLKSQSPYLLLKGLGKRNNSLLKTLKLRRTCKLQTL
jgi:hypothetical protein